MARPPLVLETHGNITRKKIDGKPTAFTRYRDADGVTRKVQRTGKTLAAAEMNLKTALKSRNLAITDAALTPDSTVNQLVSEWMNEARDSGKYRAATLRTYGERAESTIKPGVGSVRMREVSVSALDRFVKLTIKNHGPGTARTVRTVLVNAFGLAVRHGLVDFNLAKNTAPVPATRSTPSAPSLTEIRALVDHLREYDAALTKKGRVTYLHDLAMLYTATGARTAELLALTWEDVALGDKPPRIGISATLVVNEAGKLERQEHTKSDSGMRRLALPHAAVTMLHQRQEDAYSRIVFPSATGTYRWPHNLRRDWRDAVGKTEFKEITPKSFRKAVATLLRDEVGIEAARDQLGHSDERVTKQHYAQALTDAPDMSTALDLFFKAPSKR